MKKNTILSFFVLCLCCSVTCSAEEKRNLIHHPSSEELQKASQSAARPILPPVIPMGPSAVSPTPSPHIAAPPVLPQSISTQVQPRPQFSQSLMAQNIPSAPAHVSVPNISLPPNVLPQVPVIGNALGKVVNTGMDKDGISWLEVNDDLFGQSITIKVKGLNNTPIVKQAAIMHFKDIKIGDTVNVMFTNDNEENIASFINIFTAEELAIAYGEAKPQPTVTPAPGE